MSARFNEQDIREEIDAIKPKELDLRTISDFSRQSSLLSTYQAYTSRLLTADPDAVYALGAIGLTRLQVQASLLQAELNEIKDSFSSVRLGETTVDDVLLNRAVAQMAELKEGNAQKRLDNAKKLNTTLQQMAASGFRVGGFAANPKDPADQRARVNELLLRLPARVALIETLQVGLANLLTDYFNSGAYISAVDTQVDLVLNRASGYLGKGGRGVSRSLLTLTAGLALIDERLTTRDPAAPKYDGDLTFSSGIAASAQSSISLPLNISANQDTLITPDGGTQGALRVAASVSSDMVTIPEKSVGGPPSTAWSSVYPISAGSEFKMLVGNTTITMNTAGTITSLSDFSSKLNTALAATDVTTSVVGDVLTFSFTSAGGSTQRVSLYNSAAAVDVNTTLGLTYAAYGEERGTDSGFSSISLTGFAADEEPVLTRTYQELFRGDLTFDKPASNTWLVLDDDSVQAGDIVRYDGSHYRVDEVSGGYVKLDQEVLHPFDGTTLSDPHGSSHGVVILRELVTVTSQSTAWGVTRITVDTNPNALGLATTTATERGSHTRFSLAGTLKDASPIRVGDVIVDDTDTESEVGRVSSADTDITLSYATGLSYVTSTAAKIYSLGAYTYRGTRPKLLSANTTYQGLDSPGELQSKVSTFISSRSGEAAARTSIDAYLAWLSELTTALDGFSANTSAQLNKLLQAGQESGLGVAVRLLKDLDFTTFYSLTEDQLSSVLSMQEALGQVIEAFSGGAGLVTLTDEEDTWTFGTAEEDESLSIGEALQEEVDDEF